MKENKKQRKRGKRNEARRGATEEQRGEMRGRNQVKRTEEARREETSYLKKRGGIKTRAEERGGNNIREETGRREIREQKKRL